MADNEKTLTPEARLRALKTRMQERVILDGSLGEKNEIESWIDELEAVLVRVEAPQHRARTHDVDGVCTRCGEHYPRHLPMCIHANYERDTQRIFGEASALPDVQPPQEQAVERFENSIAQVLIELAFLVPRGTNIREHPIGVKLIEMVRAQRSMLAAPVRAPERQEPERRYTGQWLVLRKRETDPWEVYAFDRYDQAAMFWDATQAQWSDVFFCRVAASEGHPLDVTHVVSEFQRRAEAAEAELAKVRAPEADVRRVAEGILNAPQSDAALVWAIQEIQKLLRVRAPEPAAPQWQPILVDYLECHKAEIELGINDFGDLKPLLIMLPAAPVAVEEKP